MVGMINHSDKESGLKRIKHGNNELILVESVFDLIDIDLYSSYTKYQVKNIPYWLKNSKGELERYEMYFTFEGDNEPTLTKRWGQLEEYVNNKMMYVCQ